MSVVESGEILPLSADLAICLLHQMARLMSKLSVEPCDCPTCQTFLTAEKTEEIQPTAESVAIPPPSKLTPDHLATHFQMCHARKTRKSTVASGSQKAEMVAIPAILPESPKPQSIPTKLGLWDCRLCDDNRKFRTKFSLANHYQMCHARKTKKSTVSSGTPQQQRREELFQQYHSGNVMKCPQCGEVFDDKLALNGHFKTAHSGTKLLKSKNLPRRTRAAASSNRMEIPTRKDDSNDKGYVYGSAISCDIDVKIEPITLD